MPCRAFVAVLTGVFLSATTSAGFLAAEPRTLSFADRVKAQEAIERVYYRHRIWPKENPQPKPPFEQMVPKAVIEAKVTDYLKKCAALDKYWQRPIQPEQLQAEMDRMAKQTKDPAMLKELFAALGNDPALVAECLVRPVLADRLVRNWYANDERFHHSVRMQAETARSSLAGAQMAQGETGVYRRRTYVRVAPPVGPGSSNAGADEEACGVVSVSAEDFRRLSDFASGLNALDLREESDAFVLFGAVRKSESSLEIESLSFSKLSFESWWGETKTHDAVHLPIGLCGFSVPKVTGPIRLTDAGCPGRWIDTSLGDTPDITTGHTAVWTGSEMIIWGSIESSQRGWRYAPATDSWLPTSNAGACPAGRFRHTAVWTGTEMIVWGGVLSDGSAFFNTGGRYDPSTDQWTATSTGAGCPASRSWHTAVWAGTEMIIWGGYTGYSSVNSGGRYDPGSDAWTATSTGAGCPSGRAQHTAVWTGTEMIVWGGGSNTGGRYSPTGDSWASTSTGTSCPTARIYYTAIWTGTEMIIWGGYGNDYLNTGARYSPASDSWTGTSTGANCPSARQLHTGVWTGTEMIIWGGEFVSSVNTGGRYNPGTDSWLPTSTSSSCPSARSNHTAVWTGTEMIVWGGWPHYLNYLNTGGRYNPVTDTWVPTSTGAAHPEARQGHTAVWTGSEMIVWGGYSSLHNPYEINTGGQYSPVTDAWVPTSTGSNCPSAREFHSAVWTGSRMIIWGGFNSNDDPWGANSGAEYDPTSDSWNPTATGAGCPSGRYSHTAVWTGREMIVWGGESAHAKIETSSGGRYRPDTRTWSATSTGANCPNARAVHTATWTGTEMIIWGCNPDYLCTAGARYNPTTDSWSLVSTGTGSPSQQYAHSAVWTGTEMIIWGGGIYNTTNTGGRYNPLTDTWVPLSTGTNCPSARWHHSAIWTGSEMVVWGGSSSDNHHRLDTGAIYEPVSDSWTPTPIWPGNPSPREDPSAVWTGSLMILWGGRDNRGSGGAYWAHPTLSPPVMGEASNTCPSAVASLSTDPYGAYQWRYGGSPISGATLQTYDASLSGNYSVSVTDSNGCSGTSADKAVTVSFCAQSEVSPQGAIFPTRLVKTPSSPTGYYLYFQKIDGANYYNVYCGTMGSWYSHSGTTGRICALVPTDLGTGELRTSLTPPSGNRYYLVTGAKLATEGPSGFNSQGVEIPKSQSTCPP